MKEENILDNNGFQVVPLMRLPLPFPFRPKIKKKKIVGEQIVEILDALKTSKMSPSGGSFALATASKVTIPRHPIVLCD